MIGSKEDFGEARVELYSRQFSSLGLVVEWVDWGKVVVLWVVVGLVSGEIVVE